MDNELHDLIVVAQLERLYRFAYNRKRNEYAAEDLTQDIVLTAIRSYKNVTDKDRLIPWLWGIARNVYLRLLKQNRDIPTDEIIITDIVGASYITPKTVYLQKEDTLLVRHAVSYLAKNYRDVAVLFYLENKNYNAISTELGIPLSSVKWRLNKSKSQLREEIIKMDFMENGYRKAQKLLINMGGWVSKFDINGAYDGANKALEGLLAKNICIVTYTNPKTITEISSEMGVIADYIEEVVEALVKTQVLKK